jgi:hypothetical protein
MTARVSSLGTCDVRIIDTERVEVARMSFYRLADSHVRLSLDLGLAHAGHTTAVHVHDDPDS